MFHKTNKWIVLFLCAMILFHSPAITTLAESTPVHTNIETENLNTDTMDSDPLEQESSKPENAESESLESNDFEPDSSAIEHTESESSKSNDTAPEPPIMDSTESDMIESNTDESETTEIETFESETFESETIESVDDQSVTDAVAAFQNLLQEKPLMALLYHTDRYEVQQQAGVNNNPAATIESGHTLYIQNIEILDKEVWYQVRFWLNGAEQTGYIEAYYLAYADEDWIAWEQEYLSALFPESTTYGITAYTNTTGRADYSDISAFPGIYQENLRALKDLHPAWTFVPMRTGLDFDTAVSNETGTRNLIQNTSSNAAKGWVGSPCPTESG